MHTTRTIRTATALVGAAVLTAAGAGAPATAAPREDAAAPGALMLVMDASGSMGEQLPGGGGTKITAARAAVHDFAGALPDTQPVGLRVFGAEESKSSGRACTDSQKVVDLGTGNRSRLDSAVDAVRPFGETPIGYALQQAGKDLGTSGQRSIVLVSDGEPTCSPDPCVVAAQLAKGGVALRVDVVGLAVSGAARSKLQCIADKGAGHYSDADSADDLAQVLGQAAVRAGVPFRTAGSPVQGATSRVNAPLVRNGDWLDTLGGVGTDRQTLYYRVHRAVADSTLHVSIATLTGTEHDTVGLEVLDGEGNRCASDTNTVISPSYDPVLTATTAIPRTLDASDLACAKAGDFIVQVDHGISGSTATGRRADIPVELRVREEPPAKDVQSLPETAETPTWQDPGGSGAATKTVGSDSLASATVLQPGNYTGTLATGDVQTFAVDLDYGQSLAAAVRTEVSSGLAQQLSSGGWPYLAVRILSPSREAAAGGTAFDSDATDHHRGYGAVYQASDGSVYYQYTNTVNYRNRFATSEDLRGSSERGRYLVVVSLRNDDGNGRAVTVPFRMGIGVRGSVSGAPAYAADDAAKTGDVQAGQGGTGAGSGTSGSTGSRAAQPLDLVRNVVAVAAIGVGGLALVAGIVVLSVVIRRRLAGR